MARRSSLTHLPVPCRPGVRYRGCRLEGPGTARQALRQESGLPAGGHRDSQAVPTVRAVSDPGGSCRLIRHEAVRRQLFSRSATRGWNATTRTWMGLSRFTRTAVQASGYD
jgi:hypothetical protein